MRIVYLISYAGQAGTEKYVFDLMRVFSARGDDCRLVYWQSGPLSEKAAARGYVTQELDMSPRRVLSSAHELALYCRENAVDIIHAQYPRENVIAVLSRLWRPETEVLFTSHLTVQQGSRWQLCNRIVTPWDKAVIAVCSPGAAMLRENGVYPPRILCIPNGLEPREPAKGENSLRAELGVPEETFMFLSFARFAPEKGLDVLLKAIYELKRRTRRPFACVIAGDGPLMDDIRRLAHVLALGKNLILVGYRSDTEALLAAADAYVSSAVCKEAMSYSILEAMRAARPILTTDVGAGRELAEHCGYVAAPGDAAELAENMLRLMSLPDQGRSLGLTARQRVCREFDLRRTSERLHRIYEAD